MKKKPNILFVLSDDQGQWALGCSGNRYIRTPNIDRLAETGVRFPNSFCASPVCSPARASILTGKMPSQHGVQDWIRKGHYGEGAIDYLKGMLTLPEILKEAGYACALSGKWHLGAVETVKNRFPDHVYAHLKGSGHYYNAPMYKNGEYVEEPGYVTDNITDDAIAYLEEAGRKEQPFFLCVHYTAPHNPWTDGEHPQRLLDLYADCPFDDIPQGFIHEDAVYRYSPEVARECRKGYYAAVTAMDEGIGRILDKVEALGIREDTLIIFTSDNGFNCGHHGIWGKGNATVSLNMYDTSVKVPLILNQPGVIPAHTVAEAMVTQYDYLPTLLEYVGIENPLTPEEAPGKSFLAAAKGGEAAGHDHLVVYDEYGPVRMIRTKDWKYVHRYETENHELYHLAEDPGEDVNLYGQLGTTEVVAQLKDTMAQWFRQYSDPRLDGSRQPVRGNGQTNDIRRLAPGECAFDQNRQITSNASDDPGRKT